MSADGGPPDYRAPENVDWGAESEDSSLAQIAFLLDPAGILKRRWVWMLCTAILGLAASLVAYRLWTPVFVAQARLLVTSQQIPQDFVRSTVQESTIANINAMAGEILSAEKLGRLLDRIDVYPETAETETRIALIGRLRANTEMSPERIPGRGETSLIYEITFEHANPETAAAVANALAASFVEASTTRRTEQARQTTSFLRRELERDEAALKEQSRLVTEFRRAHRGELPEELETVLRKLELVARERRETLAEIVDAEAGLSSLRAGGSLQEKSRNEFLLEELRRRLAAELAVHTDEHPNVTALERRVSLLEEKVTADREGGQTTTVEQNREIQTEERKLERLRSVLRELRVEARELSERVDRIPKVAEDLAGLVQKQEVLREDYLDSLRKVEAAALAESLEASRHAAQTSLLDAARPPGAPELSARTVLVGGIVGSLVLAVAVGVLLELIDPVIVSAAQLDQLAKRPVLGAIPRFE